MAVIAWLKQLPNASGRLLVKCVPQYVEIRTNCMYICVWIYTSTYMFQFMLMCTTICHLARKAFTLKNKKLHV